MGFRYSSVLLPFGHEEPDHGRQFNEIRKIPIQTLQKLEEKAVEELFYLRSQEPSSKRGHMMDQKI